MFENENGSLTVLKTLTDTLADSVNGYRDAAQHVEAAEFRQLFTQLGDDRNQALSDLKAEVARLGGSVDSDGSTLGYLHQRWLDFKASVTGRDDKAIIDEVERGEDYLKDKFETALNADSLDPATRAPIERAYASVRQGHDRVRDLKHSLEGQSVGG
ncbi:ferritin-like domain-containing protein [Sphingomonas turrisvirgatae]|uniref:DUF2383 domain-containing protein n=1 Tax=Sphingomonas turrisvirgatae TaxID=1888892 RepID=A0A1E3LVI9_9SPHN|nr:PA2169 family four-helix-bundle protein [Sphingomonas turrisvirgatae]ODP37801.1 hypothetical protein BFL28_02210 [Sphingomonas turrisvirgatae]